jgi:hypothetical protein
MAALVDVSAGGVLVPALLPADYLVLLLVQPHAMEAPSELVLSQFERLYRAFFGCTASNTSNAAPDEAAHVCPVCHEGSELRLIRQIDRVE